MPDQKLFNAKQTLFGLTVQRVTVPHGGLGDGVRHAEHVIQPLH